MPSRPELGRFPLDAPVAVALGAMLGIWALSELDVMTSDLAAVLYPAVLPWYVAVLLTSGIRNGALPWLGSGILFDLVALGFMIVEAVAIGGAYHLLRRAWAGLRRPRPS